MVRRIRTPTKRGRNSPRQLAPANAMRKVALVILFQMEFVSTTVELGGHARYLAAPNGFNVKELARCMVRLERGRRARYARYLEWCRSVIARNLAVKIMPYMEKLAFVTDIASGMVQWCRSVVARNPAAPNGPNVEEFALRMVQWCRSTIAKYLTVPIKSNVEEYVARMPCEIHRK
jgi:hypothetical protein